MKISWFKALSILGLVADELTKAGQDGIITFEEALTIVARVAPAVGLKFDTSGSKLVTELVTKILDAAEDGVITISEIVTIAEHLCDALGIDLDKTGLKV